jgi:hypothetical protein
LHSKIDRSATTPIEVHRHHATTPDAVPDRQENTGRERGRNRSINRVSTPLKHLDADLGSRNMLRNNHARLGSYLFVSDD